MAPKRRVVEICQGSFGEAACKKLKVSSKSRLNMVKTAKSTQVPMKVNTRNASNSAKQQISKVHDKRVEPAKEAVLAAISPTLQAELDKELFSAIKPSYSCKENNTELVKQLIHKGANVNAKDERGTPLLHKALGSVAHDIVKLLLESGADPNCVDARGASSLTMAVYCDAGFRGEGGYDTLKLLIDSGANVNQRNKKNETVLWDAVQTGEKAMVEVLLQHGANATVLDSNGNSILDRLAHVDWDEAGLRKHDFSEYLSECSHLLQSRGAKFSQADLHEDSATLESYLEHGGKKEAQLFVKYWRKGVRGGVKKPLHTAAGNDDPRVLSVLLKSGLFDVNQRDEYGYTPLHIAARSDYKYNLELLLKYGADPNAETNWHAETAYLIARNQKNFPHIQVLLEYGAKKPSDSDMEDSFHDDEVPECLVS